MYSLLSFAVPKTVQVGSPHTDGATLPWGTYLLAGIALKCRTLKSFPHSHEILLSKGVMGTLIPRDCGIAWLTALPFPPFSWRKFLDSLVWEIHSPVVSLLVNVTDTPPHSSRPRSCCLNQSACLILPVTAISSGIGVYSETVNQGETREFKSYQKSLPSFLWGQMRMDVAIQSGYEQPRI